MLLVDNNDAAVTGRQKKTNGIISLKEKSWRL